MGAAFVVAQAHLRTTNRDNRETRKVHAVANYWKHRDEWPDDWQSGMKGISVGTAAAVCWLGAKPPVARGQMTALVERVLGCPGFDPHRLFSLLEEEPSPL